MKKLYAFRFEIFLLTQAAILFGSLLVPFNWFESWFSPLFLLLNIVSGILLVKERPRLRVAIAVIFVVNSLIFFLELFQEQDFKTVSLIKFFSLFLFYGLITFETIKQVSSAKTVEKNVIIGLISGYISLGLLSFFMFFAIELLEPNSFDIIDQAVGGHKSQTEQLLYFSFVTLLTIVYGEIVPLSSIAQKASILVALIGQFYVVILTAIVVGKYINQSREA